MLVAWANGSPPPLSRVILLLKRAAVLVVSNLAFWIKFRLKSACVDECDFGQSSRLITI